MTIEHGTLRCDYQCDYGQCGSTFSSEEGMPRYLEAGRAGWTVRPTRRPPTYSDDLCPEHAEESPMPDTTVTIDAPRDLATIRLRTATGHLYDIDIQTLAERLVVDKEMSTGLTPFRLVPTWEGVPIPDDLRDGSTATEYAREMWRRGVTDANNAHLAEPS